MNVALSPLGALLRREVITQLRRVRPFVITLLVMLIMVWTIAVSWPSTGSIVWSQIPVISTGLLSGIVSYLLVGVALFVPGVAAPAIVVEREQRSWDLLVLTPMQPSSIFAGKVLAAVATYLILVIALFPVFGSLFFLTGVDWAQGFVALSIVLLTALTCGVAGVASSAWTRRTGRAIAWSYASMFFVMGLPTLIAVTLLNGIWVALFQRSLPFSQLILTISSPFSIVFSAAVGRYTTFSSVWQMYAGHVTYQLVLIAFAFSFGVLGVKRRKDFFESGQADRISPAAGRGGPPPLPKTRKSLRQRLKDRRLRRRHPRPPIPDGRNPMAVRELWWGGAGSIRAIRVAGLFMLGLTGILLIGLWSIWDVGSTVEGTLAVAVAIHGMIVVIFSAGTAAGLFTREYELRGMDMLRITLLSPREVVRGKYIAGLRLGIVLSGVSLAANLPLFFVGWWAGKPLLIPFLAHGTLLVCAVLASSLALAVSVIAKRTSTAVVGGFAATLAVFFGLPLLVMTTDPTFTSSQNTASVDEFMLKFSSPVVGFIYAAGQDGSPETGQQWMFIAIWLVNCIEFLLLAGGAYLFAQACYARIRARDA